MKRKEIERGVVYAVQLPKNISGHIVAGFVLNLDGSVVTQHIYSRTQTYLSPLRPNGWQPITLVIAGKHRQGYDQWIDTALPWGTNWRDANYRVASDPEALASRISDLTEAALTSTFEAPFDIEGYTLVSVDPRNILGLWDPYWDAREEKEASEKEIEEAAKAEADRVWEEAAEPLRKVWHRLAEVGLVKQENIPKLDRGYSSSATPQDRFTLSSAQITALLDALPDGWTVPSGEPATTEDGWSWDRRAGR